MSLYVETNLELAETKMMKEEKDSPEKIHTLGC
ncbi:hypothetical protein T11_9983 [Trichinella zimbabwensis]|uniref:Uncharacterized protein n=1 Tax=Trichinella zimbabwensis TaxID=268475 RepID=A0A0V1GE05_9BILA|nr:hypothetical protein T11_9983 [Trichinella zimbabwensis]